MPGLVETEPFDETRSVTVVPLRLDAVLGNLSPSPAGAKCTEIKEGKGDSPFPSFLRSYLPRFSVFGPCPVTISSDKVHHTASDRFQVFIAGRRHK